MHFLLAFCGALKLQYIFMTMATTRFTTSANSMACPCATTARAQPLRLPWRLCYPVRRPAVIANGVFDRRCNRKLSLQDFHLQDRSQVGVRCWIVEHILLLCCPCLLYYSIHLAEFDPFRLARLEFVFFTNTMIYCYTLPLCFCVMITHVRAVKRAASARRTILLTQRCL